MSYNDSLQQLQVATTNVMSASDQQSASSAVCEPAFDLEGVEFNEEFLKALLNDGVEFNTTETASLHSANSVQQGSLTTSEEQSGNSDNGSNNGQPMFLPNNHVSFQYTDEQNLASPANVQQMLQDSIATSTPSKRIIKPRTQLSNQEITRLLLIYMSKALAAQQKNSSIGVGDKSKQESTSTSCMQTVSDKSERGSTSTSGTVSSKTKTTASSSTFEPTGLRQPPKATINSQSKSTSLQQPSSHCVTPKSKRKCKKSKSTGTSGGPENSMAMDCSVSVSKEGYRKNAHAKIRPYNSLDLPKVYDPLGLMNPSDDRMQQPKVAATGNGVSKGSSGSAMEVNCSEMDLSPLAQILKTVKTIPSFEAASKPKGNQKSSLKTFCTTKEPLQEGSKSKEAPGSSDQVASISDIFDTVNSLPNVLDIQSVLKYVQKRRAMRKLFKRRSHSAGSIDDLKKESKSSASLKAYTELLKARSQRLQKQLASNHSSLNLQSCMTTHSIVSDNDFEFLRSIGIDPNIVTSQQNGLMDVNGCNFASTNEMQQDTQLQTEIPKGHANLPTHSKDSYFLHDLPTEDIDSQHFNPVDGPNNSNSLFPCDSQILPIQGSDIQNLDYTYFDMQMATDILDSSVLNDDTSHVMADVYFTPEWAHTQVYYCFMYIVCT